MFQKFLIRYYIFDLVKKITIYKTFATKEVCHKILYKKNQYDYSIPDSYHYFIQWIFF